MPASFDISPVRLNYAAALRGVLSTALDKSYTFVQMGAIDVDAFLCLAASNPTGRFYGISDIPAFVSAAQEMALLRQVPNVTFLSCISQLPNAADYICLDTTDATLSKEKRESYFSAAEQHLASGGFFCFSYRAYENADEPLQFLISEFSSELSAPQAIEFLDEIKALGSLYFNDHPIARAALDKAIAAKNPKSFFDACGSSSQTVSGTFETMVSLLPRGLAFVGDAEIKANYLDLCAPPSSHAVLAKCRDHLLYEPIKDFVLSRMIRNDIWVRMPAKQSLENPELYNPFTFGITTPRSKIPASVKTQGGALHFNTPLFTRLIDLMSTLPISIGDFLSHPMGHGMNPDDVVAAMQILVAAGVAQPMRGRFEGVVTNDHSKPKWATAFNEYFTHAPVAAPTVRVASSIVGESVEISAREALVLQAVNRFGLSLSAGVLQPELVRLLNNNPSLAAQIMDAANPTNEVVHNILSQTIQNNMPRWYAYGLLAA